MNMFKYKMIHGCMASTKVMKYQLGVHDINVMTA